jgi:uncharacterized repeat protein (TIGR04076 family)
MTTNSNTKDEFQLFDLRVEVVCPPEKRIMCGAKEGDYFTLQGEMLYLPPGQGISIYSLCMFSKSDDFCHSDTSPIQPLCFHYWQQNSDLLQQMTGCRQMR